MHGKKASDCEGLLIELRYLVGERAACFGARLTERFDQADRTCPHRHGFAASVTIVHKPIHEESRESRRRCNLLCGVGRVLSHHGEEIDEGEVHGSRAPCT